TTIKDTGPGIPSNNLKQIFDPFITTKEQGKGTGLRLHIVREIVTQHDGRVTVDSTLGQGATFTVRLPALPDLFHAQTPLDRPPFQADIILLHHVGGTRWLMS